MPIDQLMGIGTNMFIAKFYTVETSTRAAEHYNVKISLMDYLVYFLFTTEQFVRRISLKLDQDFSKFNFEGVNYYGKK